MTSTNTLTSEDKVAIMELTNRFNFAIDNWQFDDFIDMFADDAVMDHPAGYGEGKENVRKFFEGYKPETFGVRHQSMNHAISMNADGTAQVIGTLLVIRVTKPEENTDLFDSPRLLQSPIFPSILAIALITDRLRKVNGEWKFTHRYVGQAVAHK